MKRFHTAAGVRAFRYSLSLAMPHGLLYAELMAGNKRGSRDSDDAEPYRLVYSTDPQPASQSSLTKPLPSGPLSPKIRMERKGRGGKTVTVLDKLPPNPTLLKALCTHLKKALGSGGTFFVQDGEGVIEVQGDWRERIPAVLSAFAPPLE